MQGCPVDCFKEYEACTEACEKADERIVNQDTYQEPIAGGQSCGAPSDCENGDGSCTLGSETIGMVTDLNPIDLGDDNSGFVAAIVVLALCVVCLGLYTVQSKKSTNKANQLQAAALNDLSARQQQETAQELAGRARTPPRDQRSPSISGSQQGQRYGGGPPSDGGRSNRSQSRYLDAGRDDYGYERQARPASVIGSERGSQRGGYQQEQPNSPAVQYGGPRSPGYDPRGEGTVRSDSTGGVSRMSRKDERAARIEKAKSHLASLPDGSVANRATTPPRGSRASSQVGDSPAVASFKALGLGATSSSGTGVGSTRRLSPARPSASRQGGAAGDTGKPRSMAFARAQILLANSQAKRASRAGLGGDSGAQPSLAAVTGSLMPASAGAGRRLTPTRSGRGGPAHPRPTTPPRRAAAPAHEAGDDE